MHGTLLVAPVAILCSLPCGLPAQNSAAKPQSIATELRGALVGSWVGTLEYRDYSEPATSTKRVKLPTWLTIAPSADDLSFLYIYDDGPAKTVTETSRVNIDDVASRYEVMNAQGKIQESYSIAGLAELRKGHGTLILTGKGTENNVPVAVRLTIRISRNILEILHDTAASGQPFTFRHAYTFICESPPAPKVRPRSRVVPARKIDTRDQLQCDGAV